MIFLFPRQIKFWK